MPSHRPIPVHTTFLRMPAGFRSMKLFAVILLALSASAEAAPAYLGCFPASSVSLAANTTKVLDSSTPAALPAACSDYCTQLNHPLAAVKLSGSCTCGGVVPDAPATAAARAAAEAGCSQAALSAADAPSVALFYSHAGE